MPPPDGEARPFLYPVCCMSSVWKHDRLDLSTVPPASCSTGNTPSSNIVVHAQARTLPLYVHRAATVIRVYGGRDETRTTAVTRACGSRRKVNIQQKWGQQPAGTIIKYRKEKADFKQKLGRQSAGKEAGKLKNDAPGR